MKLNNIYLNYNVNINYDVLINKYTYNCINFKYLNLFKINNTKIYLNDYYIETSSNTPFTSNLIKNSSFISFFIKNMIDVPICFKKSKSLKTLNYGLKLFKFINFLMRNGLKEKIFKFFFLIFFNFFTKLKFKMFDNTIDWIKCFFFINNFFKNKNEKLSFKFNINKTTIFDNIVDLDFKNINNNFFLNFFFKNRLMKLEPIFSYFIYKVDKNIRKYSRGKSGKYTFVWKYIPIYKRTYIAFRWFLKDIKFNYNKKFNIRILNFLSILFLNIESSFAWKSKLYSYNYVFKNFKKKLLLTFKTTLK